MNPVMNKGTLVLTIAGVVAASAVGGGWIVKRYLAADQAQSTARSNTPETQTYYTCTMHPQVRLDHPGNCPICGMPLVQRHDAANAMHGAMHGDHSMHAAMATNAAVNESSAIVTIDPRMVQNLGVRTAIVRRGAASAQIAVSGNVTVDERRIVAVVSRASGWVEQLKVRAVGDSVQRGEVVASVYSPDLLSGQEELRLAEKTGDRDLIDAARTRLRLLGVGAGSSAQHRVAISAPTSGVVTELAVREGAQIEPGTPLVQLADLSSVWIFADVPEAQSGALRAGQSAEVSLRALPGRRFTANIDHVYPTLDAQTRTVRVRLALTNPDGLLRPGQYADITLGGDAKSGAAANVMLVPTQAVIRTGTRATAIVAEGEGRFRPVELTLGAEQGDDIVVLSGLQAGERVVTSGQFLLDSEASLQGAYARMDGGQ